MTYRQHLNSFQQWARGYCEARGVTVEPSGNWVTLKSEDDQWECMSEGGVRKACAWLATTPA